MGTSLSKQRLGERVKAARKRLEADQKQQSERAARMLSASPETLDEVVRSIGVSFSKCSPFSETLLLLAFQANPEEVERILTKSSKQVLSAPIDKAEYDWFLRYVFPSSVWMMQNKSGQFLYERMMAIAEGMTDKIEQSMNSIYEHLKEHTEWRRVVAIENKEVVLRQDDDRVGLLKQKGICDLADAKQDGDDDDDEEQDEEDLSTFVDTNLAVNLMTNTARQIDAEFQSRIQGVMSRFGEFRAGPTKTTERCQSKVENDYSDAVYPKAARLLDVVRCSVSFNTVEQLLEGYQGLLRYVDSGTSSLELARVKNGFLADEGGYRDIKVNVVYHSEHDTENQVSMVCEVQLILNQYLHEKKRIHKLYSILRERTFFKMVVRGFEDQETAKDVKNLEFELMLNVSRDVEINAESDGKLTYKCSFLPALGLLGMNCDSSLTSYDADKYFFCVDTDAKSVIFEHKIEGLHSHHGVDIKNEQYLSIQTTKNSIQMFKIDHKTKTFEEDELYRMVLGAMDEVNFFEFDSTFQNIFFIKNKNILAKVPIGKGDKPTMSIKLEEDIGMSASKLFCLSGDGSRGALAAGANKDYFYLLDIANKIQRKCSSSVLISTLAPCFINGDTAFVAVGGYSGQGVEIWDVKTKQKTRTIKTDHGFISSTASTSNILAVGSQMLIVQLWEVGSWEMFHSSKYLMTPRSIHLTSDSRYLTVGGSGPHGEKCVILQIK